MKTKPVKEISERKLAPEPGTPITINMRASPDAFEAKSFHTGSLGVVLGFLLCVCVFMVCDSCPIKGTPFIEPPTEIDPLIPKKGPDYRTLVQNPIDPLKATLL